MLTAITVGSFARVQSFTALPEHAQPVCIGTQLLRGCAAPTDLPSLLARHACTRSIVRLPSCTKHMVEAGRPCAAPAVWRSIGGDLTPASK